MTDDDVPDVEAFAAAHADLHRVAPGERARRGCANCGDGSGWSIWRPRSVEGCPTAGVWVACADCNDDGQKPKPDLCDGCGNTRPFCVCEP